MWVCNRLTVIGRGLVLYLILSAAATAADAIPGEQWCDRPIAHIQFAGNRVTRDEVMRRELVQQQSEPCSLDDIIDGIQNIQDLGLFKSVRADLLLEENKLVLQYSVSEKIFFLPIPRFSRTSDGELRYGAQLRWDNFLGRLHQLKLTGEKRQEDDGQGHEGHVYSMDYVVPRFFGSDYGMSLEIASERRNTELSRDEVIYGEALRSSNRASFRLSRWARGSQGVGGLSYFIGAGVQQRDYAMRTGVIGPFDEGTALSIVAGFSLRQVHQDTYRRRGFEYRASISMANDVWGSDYDYLRLDATARWFLPLSRPQTNLNIQLRLGISDDAPFGERSYEIGGGELLRGMESARYSGNLLTLANVEYLSGLFTWPTFRWVVFSDIGNVYLADAVDLSKQRVRGGVGVRWKLESLTNADLRVDFAWDPQKERLKPYVSTSLTF